MKQTKYILFAVLCTLIFTSELFSQTNEEQISAIRNASNSALKSYDTQEVLSYLTDDVLTTTGNGTLLCGKDELQKYIIDGGKSRMYWIRDTKEIIVNIERGLAWESGVWNGYDPEKSNNSIINGNYSAMWTKESGIWKIKSQLFVTINEK
ncbi:YybH family protein [Draconibacterium halophilum]|uniref:Nuclear transport factor 2 family protein n=1 Tax=Draconibacterium halophilum TaxID=2706887 RepID=A0A6C0R9X3_9BACT|nr:nuclear transport factor 2 family protein [Draconibacterium halophilum]QIA07180.1 nuclear transport factor 2 family protein [Draconibacterium halophilum]